MALGGGFATVFSASQDVYGRWVMTEYYYLGYYLQEMGKKSSRFENGCVS